MWHYATDIEHLTPEGGYRDLWILAFNRWDHRKYGPSHEQRAMAAAA